MALFDTVVSCVQSRASDIATKTDVAIEYYQDDGKTSSSTTYGQLFDISTRMASVFRREIQSNANCDGFRCCGIMLEDGVELFACQLAAVLAGLAVLPLSPHDPSSRLASVFADADIALVIVRDARELQLVSSVSDVPVLEVSSVMTNDAPTYAPVMPKREDVSHVFFTSGSTGRPKGCVSTHAALMSYCEAKNVAHEIHRGDVVFCASSHMFDPHFTDFCSAMVAGATIVAAPRHSTFTKLGSLLSASGATHCLTTPVLLQSVDNIETLELNKLRLVALGGESMSKALAETWISRGVRVANTYGVTECCAYQTFREIRDPMSDDLRALGDPLPGNVLVFAAEPGDDPLVLAQDGQLAELWIGGAQLGKGYLNRSELTSERFRDGFYRTGDIVRMCVRGPILLGRRDDQVKISGQRVELGEIESAIRKTCGSCIREVKCVLNQSKQLVAWCTGTFTSAEGVVSEALRFLVAKEVPQYMVPSTFAFIDHMPMTSTGKVSRAELSKRMVDVVVGQSTISHGAFGVDLANIWSEELGVAVEFGDCDFVALGGDSLTALRVVRRVRTLMCGEDESTGGNFGEALGVFAPFELLTRPSLNDYARFIRVNAGSWPSKYDDSEDDDDDMHALPAEMSDFGSSVLFRVAAAGHACIARALIGAGIAIEAKSGSSPLHVACANAHLESVRVFLEHGSSANASGAHRRTPLLFAASSPACTSDIIKTLVAHGAKIDAIDDDKQSVLHIAARAGASSSVIETIIECANTSSGKKKFASTFGVNALDRWKRTALHWASVSGHRNVCKCLLENGIDMSLRDQFGETALDIAERRALCSAQERPVGGRPSTWGDIANLLGGSGSTKHLKATLSTR